MLLRIATLATGCTLLASSAIAGGMAPPVIEEDPFVVEESAGSSLSLGGAGPAIAAGLLGAAVLGFALDDDDAIVTGPTT